MHYRRFGRTELQIPVLSCGGMRFQHSWKGSDPVPDDDQERLAECVHRALDLGINHFETARAYGTSEEQLGRLLPDLPRDDIILQTKVGPMPDPEKFEKTFERSMELLKVDHLDLFAMHGINNADTLGHAMACWPKVEKFREDGRIRSVGFSTHGETRDILAAIETGLFDYINLHWYYIFQDNWAAVEAARAHDMGVFIISPNDKGGLLYKPSEKLRALTEPLHPMVFNALFCLMHEHIHTLSCGVTRATDFDIHMDAIGKLDEAAELVPPIVERLEEELRSTLGDEWADTWDVGVPNWYDVPNEVNLRWILRLRNLAVAYDMIEYGKMRYNLLGNGGHWFPGYKADKLDGADLSACLADSPNADAIPAALDDAHALLGGEDAKRLSESEA